MSINRKQTAIAVILREELWSLKRERRYFTFCFICFQFSFCSEQREKHAHQKDSIGCTLRWLQDCYLFCQRKLGWFENMKLSEAGCSFNFPGYCLVSENTCFYICSKKRLSTSGIKATPNASNQSLSSSVDIIGLPWVCFIYAIMSLTALGFIVVFIPETKGCSLEQISMELAKT